MDKPGKDNTLNHEDGARGGGPPDGGYRIHMYTQQIRVIYQVEQDRLSKLVRDREMHSTMSNVFNKLEPW